MYMLLIKFQFGMNIVVSQTVQFDNATDISITLLLSAVKQWLFQRYISCFMKYYLIRIEYLLKTI